MTGKNGGRMRKPCDFRLPELERKITEDGILRALGEHTRLFESGKLV
jgi:hypothetical protein